MWATLGGIALGVAGLVTQNPLLIKAGAAIASTGIATSGAKKAADQQIAGAKDAQAQADKIYGGASAEQKRVYENAAASFAPYMQVGAGATGHLGQLIGLPATSGASGPPAQAAAALPPATQQALAPSQLPETRAAMQQSSGYGGMGKREGADLGNLGGLVLLQAPTGELKRVPRGRAEAFIAQGAQVVG
jgi:hypothetical protein